MSSVVVEGNSSHPDKEAVAVSSAADLLAAGSEGRGDEIIRVLEVDLELLRVGDLNGDTVLHLLVRGGYVEPLLQLLMFMLGKNPKLLKEVAKQGNAHGDTPLHLAVKNGHKPMANLLVKVESQAFHIENGDGEFPFKLAQEIWGWDHYDFIDNKGASSEEMQQGEMLLNEICKTLNRLENEELSYQNENTDMVGGVYERLLNALDHSYRFIRLCTAFSDINIEIELMANLKSVIFKDKILEMLEVDPSLIRYKNQRGDTILHDLAFYENMDKLTKLVGQLVTTSRMTRLDDRSQLPTLSLLLEGNKNGCTPLHRAINRGNMKASRYLMEVEPEAAYRVNNDGESPLYIAIKKGYDELVMYVLQAMPEASMSAATRRSLLTHKKSSLPHAAIRFRNLTMLEMTMQSIPSLIDSLDEKGWKPLSYAAYKGYLDQVYYFLNKFPESVMKFDNDGSFPIHKAVSGGHVRIIKAFISIHPQTLYSIDKKGRNILHIAVKCRKYDILGYLKDEVKAVEKLYNLRDNDGKTFADCVPRDN